MRLSFKGVTYRWPKNPAIFLVSIPLELSEEIREVSAGLTNGFGSLRVEARIGQSIWRTSIFPDSTSGLFDLPLKAEIRKANQISEGSSISVSLELIDF